MASGAYNFLWVDEHNEVIPPPTRFIVALNQYLRAGGYLVLLSGFSKEILERSIINRLEPRLRHRVLLASSAGNRVFGYTVNGQIFDWNLESMITDEQVTQWKQIAEEVTKDYGLGRPLYSPTGQLIAEPTKVDYRDGMITIPVPGRTNIQPEIANQFSYMVHYENGRRIVEADIRVPMIKELKERFQREGLNIQVVEARHGERAINMLPMDTPTALRRLVDSGGSLEKMVHGTGNEVPFDVKNLIVVMEGRRAEELSRDEQFKRATYIAIHPAVKPEQLPEGMRIFNGSPGPIGVSRFLEAVVKSYESRIKQRKAEREILAQL